MNKSKLQVLLEESGYECRGYTPRGAKNECLAVIALTVGDLVADILATLFRWNEPALEEISGVGEQCRWLRIDQLGKGEVYYWPTIPFVKE